MTGLEPTDGLGPWQQFICRACGLIYDEAAGDTDSGLAPGTRFADIPDAWACPICGVTKADFDPYVRRDRPAASASGPARPHRQAGIVIVGGGHAGWSVAAAIRGLDDAARITLVTAGAGDVYTKPELSVAFARGSSPQTLTRESGVAIAARLDVRLMAHTDAIGLSSASKRLRTTRGVVPFTHLILAAGARPALPPNLPPALCWRINDLDAWSGLHAELASGSRRVAVIGAGMVGCELAEDLARASHQVILLARESLPLANVLPEQAARRVARGLSSVGVVVRGSAGIRSVEADSFRTKRITLDDGSVMTVDTIIAATGLTSASRLARSAGLDFDGGIVVDPITLRTSLPGVYALGDCVSINGLACRYIEPIGRQSDAIAHAVLGQPHAGYAHAPPVIRLKTRSAPVEIHGQPDAGAWCVVEDSPARLIMEQWRDGVLAARLAA